MLADLKLRREYDGFLYFAEAWRNPPILQSHRHVELEINLVIRGQIVYSVGGNRYSFGKRTLLWMFPSQEHQLISRSRDAQYYVAVFKPKLIRSCSRSATYSGLRGGKSQTNGVLNTLLEPETFDLLRKTMESLMQDALDPDLLNREAGFGARSKFQFAHGDPEGLNAGLRYLLLLCWRCRQSGKVLSHAQALHPAICRAFELLGDPNNDLSLSELANRCNVSASYLSRTFTRQLGMSLTDYRNFVRLGRFWDAYRQPVQRTIMEAMYSAGFGSYAQFYKVFANAYGQGPRKSLRQGTP